MYILIVETYHFTNLFISGLSVVRLTPVVRDIGLVTELENYIWCQQDVATIKAITAAVLY
jgi:hypothetical protein